MNKLDKWVYVNELDNSNRYVLGLSGNKPLIVFGINPSVAEPTTIGSSDPTIEKIKRITKRLECDGWIMLNVYPQRATNPNNLHQIAQVELHQRNLQEIEKILNDYPDTILVAAWGNLITKRSYLAKCLFDIFYITNKYNKKWYCFSTNKTGHPKHPLYIKEDNLSLKEFNMMNYTRIE